MHLIQHWKRGVSKCSICKWLFSKQGLQLPLGLDLFIENAIHYIRFPGFEYFAPVKGVQIVLVVNDFLIFVDLDNVWIVPRDFKDNSVYFTWITLVTRTQWAQMITECFDNHVFTSLNFKSWVTLIYDKITSKSLFQRSCLSVPVYVTKFFFHLYRLGIIPWLLWSTLGVDPGYPQGTQPLRRS